MNSTDQFTLTLSAFELRAIIVWANQHRDTATGKAKHPVIDSVTDKIVTAAGLDVWMTFPPFDDEVGKEIGQSCGN